MQFICTSHAKKTTNCATIGKGTQKTAYDNGYYADHSYSTLKIMSKYPVSTSSDSALPNKINKKTLSKNSEYLIVLRTTESITADSLGNITPVSSISAFYGYDYNNTTYNQWVIWQRDIKTPFQTFLKYLKFELIFNLNDIQREDKQPESETPDTTPGQPDSADSVDSNNPAEPADPGESAESGTTSET